MTTLTRSDHHIFQEFFEALFKARLAGPMSEAKWFPGRLRGLREQAGLTQEQVAEGAGLTGDGIAQLERGRHGPSWETVVALVKALGVDPNPFLKEPFPPPPAGPGFTDTPTAE